VSTLDYPVFDADQHLYEVPDSLLRHLPDQFAGAVKFVHEGKKARIAIQGKITEYMPNPTFERVAAPGAHEIYYSAHNTEGKTLRELSGVPIEPTPAMREAQARVELLDEQGLEGALVYPTLANLVEHSAQEDPDLVHAIIHSLNQWLYEEWGFHHQKRVVLTPVITLAIVEDAIKELEWVMERGAKAILVRPAPTRGLRGFRSPALPEFDPFWSLVEQSGLPVTMHASQPPLDDYASLWEPQKTNSAFALSAFKLMTLGHRDIVDMVTSLICHGTLTRFPKLRIASIENGSNWVAPLFEEFELTHGKMPQAFDEHPHDVFRRNIWINPFWEGDVAKLAELIGEDKVIFGSDWPHPEGMANPLDYVKYLDGVSPEVQRKVMHDNVHTFLGF
jgi:predicted TIM-barrel fold metal-dependent hydrolase